MDFKYEINKWKVRTVKYLLKYKQIQYYNTRPLNQKRIDPGDKSIMFITIAFNNARVVEEQIMRLQSMCQDEFIHVIADNSTDAEARVKIERVCDKVGATYYPLPNNNPFNNTNGSYSHGMALNYCWRNIVSNCSKLKAVMFLDHDIFPTEKFSLMEKLKLDTYHPLKMGGWYIETSRGWYLWPGYCYYALKGMEGISMNFLPSRYGDTGSSNYISLYGKMDKKEANLVEGKRVELSNIKSQTTDYVDQVSFIDVIDDNWVHLINGSDWANTGMIDEKFNAVLNILSQ